MKHFYHGITIDAEGNYTEGFDLCDYYKSVRNHKNNGLL
jgi:hypothetical protein